jgi:ATP-dependent RNA helicase RhlE
VSFDQFPLHHSLVAAVRAQGYTSPTPIQTAAIPRVLAGRDILACAQTGTGKTAAFALPILNRILNDAHRQRRPKALVLVPTRELATQVAESFEDYSGGDVRTAVIIGGVGANRQVAALRAGAEVIVAAPGRLLDLMGQNVVDLRGIHTLVLDEADRMLDMGFIQPLKRIVATLPRARQNLMFSATMPDAIRKLASTILQNPESIAVNPVSQTAGTIVQSVYHVPQKQKPELLRNLLVAEQMGRTLVFTRTKHGADRLARALAQAGVESAVIHGNKSQNNRVRALDAFRSGRVPLLIATDVAARGIDVDGVSHVINYELPNEPESYVHRIGRTGRAGASGDAIAFCDPAEREYLRQIERLTRKQLQVVTERPSQAPLRPPIRNSEPEEYAPHHDPRRRQQRSAGARDSGQRAGGQRSQGQSRRQSSGPTNGSWGPPRRSAAR